MKRWFAALTAVLLFVSSFAACGNKKPVDDGIYTGNIATATAEEEMVTVSLAVRDDPLEAIPVTNVFSMISETPASSFSCDVGEASVTVTGYNGTAGNVRIPERIGELPVTRIADGAFADVEGLSALYIPATVTSLGSGILSGTELQALHTPLLGANASAKQYLGYLFGADGYENNARNVPASLEFLSLAEGMTTLSAYALYSCNDLVAVRLPSTLTTVEKYAMYDCQKLQAVNLDRVVTVGERAFAGCKEISYFHFGTQTQSIGYAAFEGCVPVHATLPFVGGSHTENRYLGYIFGASAVDFNAGYIPASLLTVRILEGCSSIADGAFFEHSGLRRVELPSTVTSVGARAFEGCTRLHALMLPDACTSIGANAFYGCYSLKEIHLGEGLTSLGINAFYYCISLGSIRTPASLKEIPASAFAGCRSLADVTLTGVTAVEKNAFRGCTSLVSASVLADCKIGKGNDALTALWED